MNDAVIIAVANAITAQAETLKALIDALPKETKIAVEKKVIKNTPATAPVATVENVEPVVAAAPIAPVVETVTQPVVVPVTAPIHVPIQTATQVVESVQQAPIQNVMPAAPFPTIVPAATTPQTVVVPPVTVTIPSTPPSDGAVFADHKQMLKYVMDSYQGMKPEVGAQIQTVLNSIGVHNINDVKPEQYAALHAGVEALKVN